MADLMHLTLTAMLVGAIIFMLSLRNADILNTDKRIGRAIIAIFGAAICAFALFAFITETIWKVWHG